MGRLLFAPVLLEPLVEALCNDDAPFLLLHACPHAAVLVQRIVPAVDRLHRGPVGGLAFRPAGDEAWWRGQRAAHPRRCFATNPISWPVACASCRLPGIPAHGIPAQSCSFGARCCRRAHHLPASGRAPAGVAPPKVAARTSGRMRSRASMGTTHQGQRISAAHVGLVAQGVRWMETSCVSQPYTATKT